MSERSTIRIIQDKLVDFLELLARILFFWLPSDYAKGRALMFVHASAGLILIGVFFLLPPKSNFKLGIAVAALIVLTSQFAFRGCILSRAEQRLTGEKDTIADPVLRLCGIEVNTVNRMSATIVSTVAVCLILLWGTAADYISFPNYRLPHIHAL
jgi:hypothetical protein